MNDYQKRKQIFLGFSGAGRYEIVSTLKLPDGDHLIDVSDRQSSEPPTTYLQSSVHTLPDNDLKRFLLEQMKIIQAGIYDEVDEE
ncbi:hypothetical protein [Halobacillus halophilus]|uniref:hypothetical protein n=1 Tax=Halobacillus halophilus TaxID=1570 RepID=UPI001CD7756D|nr:hypothetical protein [Halobacillus halophilus]MCA1011399.1 hypothetical protein [Halobacillus halophilus]